MALSYDQVRKMALALPNVSEGRSYGSPSLHVGHKFLGRLREDGETFALRVELSERHELLEKLPDAFFLTDHYRAYPFVLVNLLAVEPATLRRLIEQAWRMLASKKAILKFDALSGTRTPAS